MERITWRKLHRENYIKKETRKKLYRETLNCLEAIKVKYLAMALLV